MPKPVLLVDFDETLIRTGNLKKDLLKIIEKAMLGPKELGDFDRALNPFHHARFTALHRSKNTGIRKVIGGYEKLLAKPKQYNFPVEAMLRDFQRDHRLVLFTYGARDLQHAKLAQSGFKKYFDQVMILDERHKRSGLRSFLGKRAVLIDDADEVYRAAREIGIPAVKIKKGPKSAAYYRSVASRVRKLRQGK